MAKISSSLYGSSSNKGFGGLVSGLDTDDLVKQMTAGTRNKINRQYQSKQKLLYKQEAYREVSSKLLAFSNKYYSYSSGSTSNILSPSFFKSNTIESSSKYVSVSGNADNIKNFTINSVTGVATNASFSSNKIVSNHTISSSPIIDKTSSLAGETMSLEYNGKTYNIAIDNNFGGDDLQKVADQLNEQLAKITDDKGIEINKGNVVLKYVVDGNQIKFDQSTTGKTAKLTAGSTKILDVLNLKTGQVAESTDAVTKSLITTKEEILKNKDAYMTFDYNGVQKTISFSKMAEKNLADPIKYAYNAEGVSNFLQDELSNAYGSGKVTVGLNTAKDAFNFTAAGSTDLLGVSSISKELSNFTGIEPSTYNRVNQNKAISETNLIKQLPPGDIGDGKTGYEISINGKEFKFEKTATLSDIMKKINSDVDAGVKIYYSSTTDTFTVKSTETGSNQGVDIKDLTGELAASLFGTVGTAGTDETIDTFISKNLKAGETYKRVGDTNVYNISDSTGVIGTAKFDDDTNKVDILFTGDSSRDTNAIVKDAIINKGTDTEITYTLNGVPTTITRSTVNFVIDGINIDLNEKAANSITPDTPVTFTVTNNTTEVVEKVKQFINDYNEMINLIYTKTNEKPNREYLPLTPDKSEEMEEEEIKNWNKEAKKGILFGDSKINNVLFGLRSSMSGKTSVSSLTLADIGISAARMDTSGKLTFDEEKFKTQLAQNADEIANLFSGTSTDPKAISGLAVQIQSILKDNVGSYGSTGILVNEAGMDNSISSNQNYISERMEEHDKKMADLKSYLEKEKQRYWNKFTALEKTMSNLNSQSSWLTSNMGS